MIQESQAREASRSKGGSSRDWLGASTCAVVACLILALAWFKLSSPDLGYHLAYGGQFLDHGRIVDRDPFLYTEHAEPFINANWGSQVIMALVHRAAGASGLVGLRIVLLVIVFTCIALTARRIAHGTHHPSRITHHSPLSLWIAWAWLLAGLAAYERFSMRPELFSYAVMSVTLLVLTRGVVSWRRVCAVGLLQLLWVNLHSYFLVGMLLTVCWLAGRFWQWFWTRRRLGQAAAPGLGRAVWLLAVMLVVQIGVSCLNPWHVRGAIFPAATLKFLHGGEVLGAGGGEAGGNAWAEISEFHSPFSFHGQIINARTIRAYYMLIAVAAVGLVAALIRGRMGPALAILLLFAMSTQLRRNIAQFAFVASPLAMGVIAGCLQHFAGETSFSRLRRYLRPCLSAATILLAAWWIGGIWSGRFYYLERRITRQFGAGYDQFTFPEEALRWLAKQDPLKPRLFVDYFSSSNTLPWLPERFKLFVDTNTFAVKEKTLRLAFDIGLGKTPHNKVFDEYGVNVVLLHCGPDTQTLILNLARDDGRWALVYFNESTVIFVRRIPEQVQVIADNQVSAEQASRVSEWAATGHGGPYYQIMARGTMVNVPMSLGWWRPAAVLAQAVVKDAPDYFEAWNYLGVCHGNLGNASARAGLLDQARGHWNEAVRCFGEVLERAPEHKEARAYLKATRQRLELLRK